MGAELGTSTIAVQEVPQTIVKRNSITTSHTRLWVAPLHINGQTTKTASTAPSAHIDAKATTYTSQEVILGEVGVKYARRDQVQDRVRRISSTSMKATNIIGASGSLPSQDMDLPQAA